VYNQVAPTFSQNNIENKAWKHIQRLANVQKLCFSGRV
jgi:hypothetical protein